MLELGVQCQDLTPRHRVYQILVSGPGLVGYNPFSLLITHKSNALPQWTI